MPRDDNCSFNNNTSQWLLMETCDSMVVQCDGGGGDKYSLVGSDKEQ